MLKPIVDSAIENVPSRYALVIGIAKRARQIVDEAEQNGEILVEKPVGLAVEEFLNKDYEIVEPPESDEAGESAPAQVFGQGFSLEEAEEPAEDDPTDEH